jgi:hypothetical protein
MALPRTRTNVPRDRVHVIVEIMLMNPGVGEVVCTEQSDHRFTIRSSPGGSLPERPRKAGGRAGRISRG